MDETQRHQAEREKPEKKGLLIHDPKYQKCPEQANPWARKNQWLSGAGEGKWGVTANGDRFFVGNDRNVLELEAVAAQHGEHTKCH